MAGWREGYRELFPQAYLDALDVEERARRWARTLADAREGRLAVAVHVDDDGRVDGFATSGPTRDADLPAGTGEVYGLYVHPGAWGAGVGGALLGAAAASLGRTSSGTDQGEGGAPPALWTLEGNRRARRFYAHHGWSEDGAVRSQERPAIGEVPGITFTEVRYRLAPASAGGCARLRG